jgi:hypothetical protein
MSGARDFPITNDKCSRLLGGVNAQGKAFFIWIDTSRNMPFRVAEVLCRLEDRGAICGLACCIGDSWDIVIDKPEEYKRKKYTFWHRTVLKEKLKDGEEE